MLKTIVCILIVVCIIKWLGNLFADLVRSRSSVRRILWLIILGVMIYYLGFWVTVGIAVAIYCIGYIFK